MKISVITPTEDREKFLKGAYQVLKNQHYNNWEWLIYDTSLKPTHFTDPRVSYLYDEGIVSIGEKRNRLIEKAKGDCIVHFDDDDYYAPYYLECVVRELKHSSFFTLHSWFSYDIKTRQFFYWDTEEAGEVRYHVSALSGHTLKEIELGPFMQTHKEQLNYKGKTGYGFSFCYTKEVAAACKFEDIDLAEDRYFYESVAEKGFSVKTLADHKGAAVHILHHANTSVEYPQYRIPRFLMKDLLPQFFDYLAFVHEEN
jgi:glycosyltransferase involved in cell wall biosynthesis